MSELIVLAACVIATATSRTNERQVVLYVIRAPRHGAGHKVHAWHAPHGLPQGRHLPDALLAITAAHALLHASRQLSARCTLIADAAVKLSGCRQYNAAQHTAALHPCPASTPASL
jgi:hypothetical protein